MRLARPKALHKAPRKAPPKVPPWRWWKRPTVRCTAPRPQGATACRAEWAWVCARSVRGRAVGHHLLLEVAQRRSEEHTSELQSHLNLVCRLLLEKKKKTNNAKMDPDCLERLRASGFAASVLLMRSGH